MYHNHIYPQQEDSHPKEYNFLETIPCFNVKKINRALWEENRREPVIDEFKKYFAFLDKKIPICKLESWSY